jgi:hypothetical protein
LRRMTGRPLAYQKMERNCPNSNPFPAVNLLIYLGICAFRGTNPGIVPMVTFNPIDSKGK